MSSRPYPTRALPKQPNLGQLRKQAKDLMERYRAGNADAAAEVHRFERRPDPAEFALHDAQRVLARAYGFDSWAKLKAFTDGANVARLVEAVQAGDLAQARALLKARPELVGMDVAENNEHRALHFAVLRRDAEMVKLLMEAGADARKGIFPHRDATTAYALARDRGYTEIVVAIEQAEQRRREASSCPNTSVSPVQDEISRAIHAGDADKAKRLLAEDESLIRACDREGATALHAAAGAGMEELVRWLLSHGASARKRDLKTLTPLDWAALSAASQFPTLARMLLDAGAEITIRAAVALGDVERTRQLVKADPSTLREIHWSRGGLLSLAVKHGNVEMVRLLLDLSADPDERTLVDAVEEPTPSAGTPLWYAALAGRRDIVEVLLDAGADPNANVYASGWPLRNALVRKHEDVKQLLLARGARPQPYMIAEAHDLEQARRLLESDPSEELARELCWSAACHGYPAIVEMARPRLRWPAEDPRWDWVLIQPMRGVEDDGRDHEGFFACMRVLLESGVSPNVSSRFGQTALHFRRRTRRVGRNGTRAVRGDAAGLRRAPGPARRFARLNSSRLGVPLGSQRIGAAADHAGRAGSRAGCGALGYAGRMGNKDGARGDCGATACEWGVKLSTG